LVPGSRFAWLPVLAMLYPSGEGFSCNYRRWGSGQPYERRMLEQLQEDIRVRRPAVIVATKYDSQGLRPGCSVSEWLRESGLLERAMSEYERLPDGVNFEIWALPGAVRPRSG
jgi:hypothetical protein